MTIWTPNIAVRQGPRYLAIADCLDEDLRRGRLGPGDRLPPQRELADRLGLTVGTVTRAYAEADRRGLVRGEVGRGTFVREESDATVAGDSGEPIDLALNLPLSAEDPDLGATLQELARRPDVGTLLAYQPTPGTERHRRAGATWLARHGVEVDPAEVVVTAGAQHAITVLLGTLCRPGDTVLAESLTYPGLKSVAGLLGLRLRAVALDQEGLIPEALDAACREEGGGKVLYVLPTLHNPTTATMGEGRRRAVVEVARRHDLQVVEDDVHRLLEPGAPSPLASRAPERTHYVASTSKVVAGGLRVAFVAVPPGAAERIVHTVSASLWIPPPLTAELATMWIEDGTAESVTLRKRDEAAARQELAAALLPEEYLRTAPQSYFLWLKLPAPWRAEDFARQARRRGVSVATAEAFALDRDNAPAAVRVSLSAPRGRREVEAGLRILADVLARGPAPEPAIV